MKKVTTPLNKDKKSMGWWGPLETNKQANTKKRRKKKNTWRNLHSALQCQNVSTITQHLLQFIYIFFCYFLNFSHGVYRIFLHQNFASQPFNSFPPFCLKNKRHGQSRPGKIKNILVAGREKIIDK